uniref:hypothetical protein n=1 Tax=Paenibacillus sp. 1-18 TaxID=1333846 RepID=UPI0006768446
RELVSKLRGLIRSHSLWGTLETKEALSVWEIERSYGRTAGKVWTSVAAVLALFILLVIILRLILL